MKLGYEEIEDGFDDTTNIRAITEQAAVKNGLLVRATAYSPHHLRINVVFVLEAEWFDPVID